MVSLDVEYLPPPRIISSTPSNRTAEFIPRENGRGWSGNAKFKMHSCGHFGPFPCRSDHPQAEIPSGLRTGRKRRHNHDHQLSLNPHRRLHASRTLIRGVPRTQKPATQSQSAKVPKCQKLHNVFIREKSPRKTPSYTTEAVRSRRGDSHATGTADD